MIQSIEEIISKCRSIGYEYIDGYNGSNSTLTLKCPKCGKLIKRNWRAVRKIASGYQQSFVCTSCVQIERNNKAHEAEQNRKIREQERERKLWESKFEQTSLLFCKKCNRPFIGGWGKEYCSQACVLSKQYTRHKDKRLRKIKGRYKDYITVKKLYKRDNGICYLCGGKCDFEDYTKTDSGAFIAGYKYPSIDHVIPLAKGGFHSWDNVKLAHFICNTRKRDSLIVDKSPDSSPMCISP